MNSISEYPRPQLVRDEYLILDGQWQFAFDDSKVSLKEHWENPDKALDLMINVPFSYESTASGIDNQDIHQTVYYKRKFTVPSHWEERRLILHFGAVDYRCKIYINGHMVGEHEGGHTPFYFDITDFLINGQQDISVWVEDPASDETIPRGKQTWEQHPRSIWYTRTTGIWQTVWLEPVAEQHISSLRFTPHLDRGDIGIEVQTSGDIHDALTLQYTVHFKDKLVAKGSQQLLCSACSLTLNVFERKIFNTNAHDCGRTWSPEHPNLFDISFILKTDEGIHIDNVTSYFGMRKIHTQDGMVYLNNRPYFMKLVLDQGYWPDCGMTAPDSNALEKDILLAKAMGFNGCRKHQKVEDARFMYHADHLGYLVWGEMASCATYSPASAQRTMREWMEVINRDYSHPCIVAWVPLNESWGISQIEYSAEQQAHSLAMYHMIKSLDNTRLVVGNDGWEQTRTDICAIHNYAHGEPGEAHIHAYYRHCLSTAGSVLASMPAQRRAYVGQYQYSGEPIILTEFGGISYRPQAESSDDWGYTSVQSSDGLLGEYERLVGDVFASSCLCGFCYTQLTDVQQEANGLLTAEREFKCEVEKIRGINCRWQPPVIENI